MGITLEEIEGFEGEWYRFRGFTVRARAFASYAVGDRIYVQWRDGQPLTILSVTARPGAADDTSQKIAGGFEALIVLTRNGARELWFADAFAATQIGFPVLVGTHYGQLFRTATTVSAPVWGQRDDSFYLTLDRLLPTEKTLVVTLNRPGPGTAMGPVAIKNLVEASRDLSWYTPGGVGVPEPFGEPTLDAASHLVQPVSWQFIASAGALDLTGYAVLLDLTTKTVRQTIPVAPFGPPSFPGEAGLATFGFPTIFHLDAAAPKKTRIGVVASSFGVYDAGHPDPGPPTPNHSLFLGVVDGEGTLVTTLSPWTTDESPGTRAFGSFLFTDGGTRRHALWSITTGSSQLVFATDLVTGLTTALGTVTIDGFGVTHPVVAPGVVSIRPDFALRVNSGPPTFAHIEPYFVQWWDKNTGAVLLPNPLTDAALQTEDPALATKKTLRGLPSDAVPVSFSYHVVEDSPSFPYAADKKTP